MSSACELFFQAKISPFWILSEEIVTLFGLFSCQAIVSDSCHTDRVTVLFKLRLFWVHLAAYWENNCPIKSSHDSFGINLKAK